MHYPRACLGLLCLLGLAAAQTPQAPTPGIPVSTRPAPETFVASAPPQRKIQPVILTRAVLDEKIVTLRLAPRVATPSDYRNRSTRWWWETRKIFKPNTRNVNRSW